MQKQISKDRFIRAVIDAGNVQEELWKYIQDHHTGPIPDESEIGKLFALHEASSTEVDWCLAEITRGNTTIQDVDKPIKIFNDKGEVW